MSDREPVPVPAPTPTAAGTPTPMPRSYGNILSQLQQGWEARGNTPNRPPPFAGMDMAMLLGGLFGGGPGTVVPPVTSPGIGAGMDYPTQYEDGSYGYQGSYRDKLMLLMESIMNRRFPNDY